MNSVVKINRNMFVKPEFNYFLRTCDLIDFLVLFFHLKQLGF